MTEGEVEAMESLLPVDLILLGQCLLSLFFCLLTLLLSCSHVFLLIFCFLCKKLHSGRCFSRCPSLETKWQSCSWVGKKGVTKVFKHGQKIPSDLKLLKVQLITMFV